MLRATAPDAASTLFVDTNAIIRFMAREPLERPSECFLIPAALSDRY
jgi:hypothetical protein